MITSRQHPIVKMFRAVARGDATRALVDGWHLLHDAAAAGAAIETVAVCGEPAAADRQLLDELSSSAQVIAVSTPVMDALSPVRTPSGVAALVRRPSGTLARVVEAGPALVVVGIDLQDPGNVGATIRSAEAAGATGMVLAGASADPWGWKALRAAMGSTFRVPLTIAGDPAAACATLQAAGLRLLATVPRDGQSMYDADLRVPVGLLIGSEGAGLPPAVTTFAHASITIPMDGRAESLNVAVAAAILLYEAQRQRRSIR